MFAEGTRTQEASASRSVENNQTKAETFERSQKS